MSKRKKGKAVDVDSNDPCLLAIRAIEEKNNSDAWREPEANPGSTTPEYYLVVDVDWGEDYGGKKKYARPLGGSTFYLEVPNPYYEKHHTSADDDWEEICVSEACDNLGDVNVYLWRATDGKACRPLDDCWYEPSGVDWHLNFYLPMAEAWAKECIWRPAFPHALIDDLKPPFSEETLNGILSDTDLTIRLTFLLEDTNLKSDPTFDIGFRLAKISRNEDPLDFCKDVKDEAVPLILPALKWL